MNPFGLKKNKGNAMRHIISFCHRTVADWNSLSSSVVLLNSGNCLKERLINAWRDTHLNLMLIIFNVVVTLLPRLLRLFIGRGGVIHVIHLPYPTKVNEMNKMRRTLVK